MQQYSVITKIHIDQLKHGLALIKFDIDENRTVTLGNARPIDVETNINSVYLQGWANVNFSHVGRRFTIGPCLAGVPGPTRGGQSQDCRRRHPDWRLQLFYIQVYQYERGQEFNRDTGEMAIIFVSFLLEAVGHTRPNFADKYHQNFSPFALQFMFYLTFDDFAGTVGERSVGFSINGLTGVKVDELPEEDAAGGRWIGASIQAVLDAAHDQGMDIVGTAPPESLRGQDVILDDLVLIRELFGGSVVFRDAFPKSVSTRPKNYNQQVVEDVIQAEKNLEKELGTAKVVGVWGHRNCIVGRAAYNTDTDAYLDAMGSVVLDQDYEGGKERLYFWMLHGSFDSHYASMELRQGLLPRLRQLDVLAMSVLWASSKLYGVKEALFRFNSSHFPFIFSEFGRAIKESHPSSVSAPVRVADEEKTQGFVELYADLKGTIGDSEAAKTFEDELMKIDGMRQVNRYIYYCSLVEPSFGSLSSSEKAVVLSVVKKVDNYAQKLGLLPADLRDELWALYSGTYLDFVKTVTYLMWSVPNGDDKMDTIANLLLDEDA